MNRQVNFDVDVSTESPSTLAKSEDESMHVSGSSPPEQASLDNRQSKMWVPVRLELRLRCERVDSDGSSQCVWMLQDERANTEFNFESLYFKGSKNDEKAPVVRQYAQRGNIWCVAQRKDNLALGAEGTSSDGWVMVTNLERDADGKNAKKEQMQTRYVASLPLGSDFPESQADMVAQIRMRTRPFYTATSICEGLSPEMLQFCAPRKDEHCYDPQEDNDVTTLTQRFPLSALSVDSIKSNVTLHLFNGRLSIRLQRVSAESNRWLVQAFRIIARIVPSTALRKRPVSSGSRPLSARSAPRTPSGAGIAAVAAKETLGAGFYGMGVAGWKGKFFRAVRTATRLRVSKLLELVAGLQRVNVRSVIKGVQSLHSTGMFILDSVDTLFLWLGTNTGKKQNLKAQEFVAKYCPAPMSLQLVSPALFHIPRSVATAHTRSRCRYVKMPFFDVKGKTVQRAPYFKVSCSCRSLKLPPLQTATHHEPAG